MSPPVYKNDHFMTQETPPQQGELAATTVEHPYAGKPVAPVPTHVQPDQLHYAAEYVKVPPQQIALDDVEVHQPHKVTHHPPKELKQPPRVVPRPPEYIPQAPEEVAQSLVIFIEIEFSNIILFLLIFELPTSF